MTITASSPLGGGPSAASSSFAASPPPSLGSRYVQCRRWPECSSTDWTATSQLDPNIRTSYAVPSPSLIRATSPCVIPCEVFMSAIPSGTSCNRPSIRSVTRGRSNQRSVSVVTTDTAAAVGIICVQLTPSSPAVDRVGALTVGERPVAGGCSSPATGPMRLGVA